MRLLFFAQLSLYFHTTHNSICSIHTSPFVLCGIIVVVVYVSTYYFTLLYDNIGCFCTQLIDFTNKSSLCVCVLLLSSIYLWPQAVGELMSASDQLTFGPLHYQQSTKWLFCLFDTEWKEPKREREREREPKNSSVHKRVQSVPTHGTSVANITCWQYHLLEEDINFVCFCSMSMLCLSLSLFLPTTLPTSNSPSISSSHRQAGVSCVIIQFFRILCVIYDTHKTNLACPLVILQYQK